MFLEPVYCEEDVDGSWVLTWHRTLAGFQAYLPCPMENTTGTYVHPKVSRCWSQLLKHTKNSVLELYYYKRLLHTYFVHIWRKLKTTYMAHPVLFHTKACHIVPLLPGEALRQCHEDGIWNSTVNITGCVRTIFQEISVLVRRYSLCSYS